MLYRLCATFTENLFASLAAYRARRIMLRSGVLAIPAILNSTPTLSIWHIMAAKRLSSSSLL